MGWFGDDSDQAQASQQLQDPDNQPKMTHELAAGAAAYYAAREYEKHCDNNGQPQSHEEAKELVAGFAGAFADREVEPRMEDAYDREKIKRDAVSQCQNNGLDQQYGQGQQDQQYGQGQQDQQYGQGQQDQQYGQGQQDQQYGQGQQDQQYGQDQQYNQ